MGESERPTSGGAHRGDSARSIRALNLVTTPETRFFRQQVRALRERGVETDVLAVPTRHEFDYGTEAGRTVTNYLRFAPMVWRASLGDYDLVHANYGLTAPPAVLQPRLPVVVSLWGSDLMGRFGRLSEWCAGRAESVVVMSEEMAARLDRDVAVIPHGVDLERFHPRPQWEARAELGWDPGSHHVLFPYSTSREVKNFDRARRVADAAASRLDAPVALQTVVGEPHERMSVYHNAADCLLLTSHREGSPNSVKEAMACNTPVVATDVGDVRERLDGVTPSVVGDTDETLIAGLVDVLDGGERSNGRQAVRELTPAETARRLECIYREVVASD